MCETKRFESRRVATALFFLALVLVGCEGDGSGGSSPTIEFSNSSECIRFDGSFPSDLALLPGADGEAAVVQLLPIAILGLDLDREPPRLLARDGIPGFPEVPCGDCSCGVCGDSENVGIDSDSDGDVDACRNYALGFGCDSPVPGELLVMDARRVALSTTNIEQIVFIDPRTNLLLPVELETPAASPSFEPADWPFWPPPNTRPVRTALSTRTCVYGEGLVGSLGSPIGNRASCDGVRNGFSTRFTAGAASVRGHIFAATSNFLILGRGFPSQFAPGTVLVFDYDATISPPRARPNPNRPVIQLTGYNPTGVTAYQTPNGRDLILVNVTGAIVTGTGTDLVRTDSSIDVIDAESLELIATIPLGRAGLGFSGLAIDPSRRLALAGAATSRALFGIDLAALDDPALGLDPESRPVVLDGSDANFPDARVFSATTPFRLPKRTDGAPESVCATQTSVSLSVDADWGVTSDFCDGTVSLLGLRLPASRTTPLDPEAILRVERVQKVAFPLVAESFDRTRAIDRILIRPGRPGIDFSGPDVYFSAGLEVGAVCGTHINALD